MEGRGTDHRETRLVPPVRANAMRARAMPEDAVARLADELHPLRRDLQPPALIVQRIPAAVLEERRVVEVAVQLGRVVAEEAVDAAGATLPHGEAALTLLHFLVS